MQKISLEDKFMIRLTEKSVFEVKANYDSANAAASDESLKDMQFYKGMFLL